MPKSYDSPEYLRKFYQRKGVVNNYFDARFRTPLGKVQHEQQVSFVYSHLIKFKSEKVLEIATGPARVSAHIQIPQVNFIGIDASKLMLEMARNKLEGVQNNSWNLVLADDLNLPFPSGYFDCVFAFRFIRHLKRQQRSILYSEIKRVLKSGGFLIFDAPNIGYADTTGTIYDQHWAKAEIKSELWSEGFVPKEIIGNLRCYWLQNCISGLRHFCMLDEIAAKAIKMIERKGIYSKPLEWLVLCQR